MNMADTVKTIEFGLMARPITEQFPCLQGDVAAALEADSTAMSRLAVRGYLTASQKGAVAKRIASAASKAIAKAEGR
jgi:hypothetical protein